MKKYKNHGVGSLMCEVCGLTFTHLQTLRKHKKRFQDEICYQCSDCAYEAEDSGALKKHRRYSHNEETFNAKQGSIAYGSCVT